MKKVNGPKKNRNGKIELNKNKNETRNFTGKK